MPEINLNKPILRAAYLRRALTPEQIELRQAEFVISTEAVDSHNTVFKISGWDLTRYDNNPVVGYNHLLGWGNDDPDNVIGTSEVFVEDNQLIGRVTFERAEVNPKAEKIFQKVQSGTLRMASVGANPTRGHWGDEKLGEDKDVIYFDDSMLLEWCVVDLGSNPEALKRSADNLAEIIKEIPKQAPPAGTTIKRSLAERQLMLNKKKSTY